MRKYIVSATASLMIWSGTASAQTLSPPLDIPFRDIFDVLVAKVNRSSDQNFFEREVLQAGARKEAAPNAQDSYNYSYGSELSGKGSTYVIYSDEKGTHRVFRARDFSDHQLGGCVNFREAHTKLQDQDWNSLSRPRGFTSPGEVNISEYYQRDGAVLEISYFDTLLPFPEPWNSAEANKQGRDDAIKEAGRRQNLQRGTDGYESRCITSVSVEILQ